MKQTKNFTSRSCSPVVQTIVIILLISPYVGGKFSKSGEWKVIDRDEKFFDFVPCLKHILTSKNLV